MSSVFSGDETAPFFGFLGAAAALVFSCTILFHLLEKIIHPSCSFLTSGEGNIAALGLFLPRSVRIGAGCSLPGAARSIPSISIRLTDDTMRTPALCALI